MPFNNAAERGVRGIALGRKSWLFCGSDRGGERAAIMYSLIVTAKMNDIDPQAWLADVLARIQSKDSMICCRGTGVSPARRPIRPPNIAGISYLIFTISRVAEICYQFGGSASEISCASLASAKTSSRITRIVT